VGGVPVGVDVAVGLRVGACVGAGSCVAVGLSVLVGAIVGAGCSNGAPQAERIKQSTPTPSNLLDLGKFGKGGEENPRNQVFKPSMQLLRCIGGDKVR